MRKFFEWLLASTQRSPQPPASEAESVDPTVVRVTPDLLQRLGVALARDWAVPLDIACRSFGITTKLRVAHFLATVMHESQDFYRLTENLNYSVEGLMRTWPARFPAADAARMGRRNGQLADERAIAERAYGGRMGNGPEGAGDGYLYRGRGLIQLTGKTNYREVSKAVGVPLDKLPAWLETREGAASSAAWWWSTHGCNSLADADDVVSIRRIVNGGGNGLSGVVSRVQRVMAALNA